METVNRTGIAAEKHYSPKEIAGVWRVALSTVRRIFEDQAGVLKISHPHPRQGKGKRKYAPRVTLRIPESVLRRVHEQRSAGFGTGAR